MSQFKQTVKKKKRKKRKKGSYSISGVGTVGYPFGK